MANTHNMANLAYMTSTAQTMAYVANMNGYNQLSVSLGDRCNEAYSITVVKRAFLYK